MVLFLKKLHCAVLHAQAVPVWLLTCLHAAPPLTWWPASLQGFMGRGCISTRPSPAHKYTAAFTAQHQLNTCHLNEHIQQHTQSVTIILSLFQTCAHRHTNIHPTSIFLPTSSVFATKLKLYNLVFPGKRLIFLWSEDSNTHHWLYS